MAVKSDFSWIMSDKPKRAVWRSQYTMISCCGGGNEKGYVADDCRESVCRWDRMMEKMKKGGRCGRQI